MNFATKKNICLISTDNNTIEKVYYFFLFGIKF